MPKKRISNKPKFFIFILIAIILIALFVIFNGKKPEKKEIRDKDDIEVTITPTPTIKPSTTPVVTPTNSSSTNKQTILSALTDFSSIAMENGTQFGPAQQILDDSAASEGYYIAADIAEDNIITFDTFSSVISKYSLKLNSNNSTSTRRLYEKTTLACSVSITSTTTEIKCW